LHHCYIFAGIPHCCIVVFVFVARLEWWVHHTNQIVSTIETLELSHTNAHTGGQPPAHFKPVACLKGHWLHRAQNSVWVLILLLLLARAEQARQALQSAGIAPRECRGLRKVRHQDAVTWQHRSPLLMKIAAHDVRDR
jgi:hypothetical protein